MTRHQIVEQGQFVECGPVARVGLEPEGESVPVRLLLTQSCVPSDRFVYDSVVHCISPAADRFSAPCCR
jgi:hypothetical protein